jgi:suppressor for copper-sensitivity B
VAAVLAAAAAVMALLMPLAFPGGPSPVSGPVSGPVAEGAVAWQPFDRARMATLVSQGKTVFVDVTAEWCVTCQVNKLLVLDNAEVAARLNAPGVVAMLADWTQPSDEISRYLASFGRYGIPFNAVYGPKAPTGIALPELLGVATVLEALAAAGD